MNSPFNTKDPSHSSHDMVKPRIDKRDGKVELNNSCSKCQARMWGIPGDWNNDTALELPCSKSNT